MSVYFIGCLHLSHKWMAQHRGFQDEFYHDEHLIESWNKTVKHKKDIVWVLGDISMESPKPYPLLNRLTGEKRVVLGNHDLYQDVPELMKYVKYVAGMVDYKGYVLSHVPIHPSEISFCRGNIHAHIHEQQLEECIVKDRYGDVKTSSPTLNKYFNVDAQRLNYKPISIDEITAALQQKNWEKPKRSNITWEI